MTVPRPIIPDHVRDAFRHEIAERERIRLAELRFLGLEPHPISDEMKAAITKSVSAMRSAKAPAKRFRLWPRSVSR